MKTRRLATPKEKIARISRKTAGDLRKQYTEVLRLRDEIRRLTAPGAKTGQSDRT
jgi:hypothetical protein